MVDLPASKTPMRNKTKARKYIDPDAFYLARKQAGLSVKTAAIELDVTERTIRNYECGAVRIPYPAFRLMRVFAGYQLVGVGKNLKSNWEDWSFWQNKLWTPEGRSFEPHELRYLNTFISLARHYLKLERENKAAFGGASYASKPPTLAPKFVATLRSPPRGSPPAKLVPPHPLATKRAENTEVEIEAA